MAAYKLEDNIREKMEARELKPSANAWEKLEAKLEAELPKKKKFLWYYVAASLIALLILSSVFLNESNLEVNNEIVNENVEPNNVEIIPEIISNNSKAEEIVSAENDSEKGEPSKSKAKEKQKENLNNPKPLSKEKSEIDKKIQKSTMVAEVSEENRLEIVEQLSILSEEDKILNTKVDEVVASVKKLQESNDEISIEELEALLSDARRDIQTERILNSPKVDATALLKDVEWDLEKSFRDKVFDALGEGFNKIRTAVIERND